MNFKTHNKATRVVRGHLLFALFAMCSTTFSFAQPLYDNADTLAQANNMLISNGEPPGRFVKDDGLLYFAIKWAHVAIPNNKSLPKPVLVLASREYCEKRAMLMPRKGSSDAEKQMADGSTYRHGYVPQCAIVPTSIGMASYIEGLQKSVAEDFARERRILESKISSLESRIQSLEDAKRR